MSNFEVISNGGYVDIFPHATVALNAEVLSAIVERIKTELGFTESISIGDGAALYQPTYQFGIRLNGANADMAERLRGMDLFPALKAEKRDAVEFRFVHMKRAYIDPRLILTVGELVSCAHAFRTQFGRESGIGFENGQLFYGASSTSDSVSARMKNFCEPLYRAVSAVSGGYTNGHAWMRMFGPLELLENLDKLPGMENIILQDPKPILYVGPFESSKVSIWLNVGAVETVADVERVYEAAASVALALGIHPVGDFEFSHNIHVWTTLQPSPHSSR